MTLLHRLASFVRRLVHRNSAEQDLDDEVHAFVDMAAADRMRDGVSPADARRIAALDLGGVEQTKERVRSARYALRMCGRPPVSAPSASFSQLGLFSGGFSSATIEVEGSALTVNTAVESALDRVGADYFRTLGIPIRFGRDISVNDRRDTVKVCDQRSLCPTVLQWPPPDWEARNND